MDDGSASLVAYEPWGIDQDSVIDNLRDKGRSV